MMTLLRFIRQSILDTLSLLYRRFRVEVLKKNNKTCRIASSSVINNITLGKYVTIFKNTVIQNTIIDNYTFVQKNTHIYNAIIGKFCSIGPNVTIAPGHHLMTGITTHPSFFEQNTPLPIVFTDKTIHVSSKVVKIGCDVWIGKNAILMDGVEIGHGAIIGAGAIVTKNVLPYQVVGGVPAKLIKQRFKDEEIEIIINSAWWNNDDEWFFQNVDMLNNPDIFLNSL